MIEVKDATLQDYAGDYNVSRSILPLSAATFSAAHWLCEYSFLKNLEVVETG